MFNPLSNEHRVNHSQEDYGTYEQYVCKLVYTFSYYNKIRYDWLISWYFLDHCPRRTSFSAVVLSWIIISITVYGIRNGKLRKENKLTSGNLSSRKIYMSAILAMLSNLFCVVVDVLSRNYSYNKPCDHCYALCKLYDFVTVFTHFAILLFLWLRQRSFYLHPSLSVLNQFLPIRLLN